ncbi:Enoyl reductase LovC [Beauveria bassiana]|nr:Enoyl reductase LovC [Beauveria bassiana]KAH8708327.1 Trans-enoyl reductase [Beauveria bassiana]
MAAAEAPKIPRIHRALAATGQGTLTLKAVPVPRIAHDEVLVRVAAVALNPSDHKLLDQSTTVGAISGSDFAGTVVKVGTGVRDRRKVGDRVFGFVFGANPGNPGNGAFAQYVAATVDICMPIPDGMDFDTAASVGMGSLTVGLVFRSLGLRWPQLDHDEAHEAETISHDADIDQADGLHPFVLVHGGASATGTMALQFLRLAGYRPITTCSPANFAMVRGRGAEQAFDYSSSTCHEDIRRYTGERLRHAFDCIGSVSSMTLCYSALGEYGGHYTALEQYPRRLTIRRRDVTHDWILGWTFFGKEVKLAGAYYRPVLMEDRELGRDWGNMVARLLAEGRLLPHPVDVHKGTLNSVIPRLDMLRRGQIKGKKVVVRV